MSELTQFTITELNQAYWRVTFDNPPTNLVNPETILELQEIVSRIESASDLIVVVFDSAHPDYFMARYDLSRVADTPTTPGPTGLPTWIDLTARLEQANAISIAKVRGRARGAGSEFCLACDLRFASSERAIFGQPEVAAGVIPGGGGIERLAALVGRARALEIVIGGEDFPAEIAERYGWINRALPDAELDAFVDQFAGRLASFDTFAIAEAKRLLNRKTLPLSEHLLESQTSFLTATKRPELLERGRRTRNVAIAAGADFELRLGHYLGQV